MQKSRDILESYWGYSFRPLQEEIVDNAIYGHDTLAILPTGGGKSICFQVPGIAREGITVVISPLIALMEDQVNNLNKRGIKAVMLSSAMSYRELDIELDNARFGNTKFIYLSPERLQSKLFVERFKLMNVGLVVIDEAHCISEWGPEFRPSYGKISALRAHHPEVPFMALTASATHEVRADIIEKLELRNPKVIEGSVERENLIYEVLQRDNKLNAILEFCKRNNDASGIVYCQTRKSVKEIAIQLRAAGIAAGIYHGGMTANDRSFMLKEWLNNNLRIMVATNAFGMGIDKPDVRFVLHFEFPNNLEAYYQEAGRAGRDGKDSRALIFYNKADIELHQQQLERKYPSLDKIKKVYDAIGNYLQIAIGSGLDESFGFNLNDFSKKFNLNASEVYASLKILAANNNIYFEENVFLPTRMRMIIGQAALYKFQVAHPDLNTVILPILRSYPGVFDRFVRIDEKKICEITNLSIAQLRKKLEQLAQFGVIELLLQTDEPQLVYTQERKSIQELQIAPEVYINRKEKDKYRLDQVVEYISSSYCRSALISTYFGSNSKRCGKCDNCLKENNPLDQDTIKKMILSALPGKIEHIEQLLNKDRSELKDILRALLLEEKIALKDEVFIRTSF